jgi:tetratricopeptide (TPR) repeat protein
MINLLLSILAGLAAFAVFRLSGIVHTVGAILPGLVAVGVTYFFLARRTMRQFEAIMGLAQKELSQRKLDRAVAVMESAFALSRWQFLVASQLHGQIGSLLYVQKKFDEAEPHLKKAFIKMWTARAMLAAQHYKRQDFKAMEDTFEAAVRANKGESLLYAVYAWCQEKRGEKSRAIEILQRGVEQNKSDERLKTLLARVQNDKRMKMDAFGQEWDQFWLETPKMMQQPGGGGFGVRQFRNRR